MDIATFTNSYKPFIGEVPISIEWLSEGLRSPDHGVTALTPESEGKLSTEQEKDVVRFKVFYRKADRGMVLRNCFDRKIEASLGEGNFNVIHVHHPMLVGQAASYLRERYSILVAYAYHARYEKYLYHLKLHEAMASGEYPVSRITGYGREIPVPALITTFSNRCDLVFVPTSAVKDRLLEQGTKTRVSVLLTGLDRVPFQYDEVLSSEIRNMYENGCLYLFTTTARLEEEKNLDFLSRGTTRLRDILGQGFRLMVIGDSTERRHLEELARMLGISCQIVSTGKIKNARVRHYLNAADAFLFASKSETQGIMLLEATAASCPVAAVRASDVAGVVRRGINGYMTGGVPEAFTTAVARLVLEQGVWSEVPGEARKIAELHESGRIAALAVEQYGLIIGQKEDAGYEERGKNMLASFILWLLKAV